SRPSQARHRSHPFIPGPRHQPRRPSCHDALCPLRRDKLRPVAASRGGIRPAIELSDIPLSVLCCIARHAHSDASCASRHGREDTPVGRSAISLANRGTVRQGALKKILSCPIELTSERERLCGVQSERLLLKESGCCATSQAASASDALDKWQGSFYGGHRWSKA